MHAVGDRRGKAWISAFEASQLRAVERTQLRHARPVLSHGLVYVCMSANFKSLGRELRSLGIGDGARTGKRVRGAANGLSAGITLAQEEIELVVGIAGI